MSTETAQPKKPGRSIDLEYGWSIEDNIIVAAGKGFEVIRASPSRLLLDLDDAASLARYQSMKPIVASHWAISEVGRWHSKSGRGFHVEIACDIPCFLTRVALQLALGSDPKREALAVAMFLDGIPEPSCLFKPRQEPTP